MKYITVKTTKKIPLSDLEPGMKLYVDFGGIGPSEITIRSINGDVITYLHYTGKADTMTVKELEQLI